MCFVRYLSQTICTVCKVVALQHQLLLQTKILAEIFGNLPCNPGTYAEVLECYPNISIFNWFAPTLLWPTISKKILKDSRVILHTSSVTPRVIFFLRYLNFHSDTCIASCSFFSTQPCTLVMFSNTIQPPFTVTMYQSPPIVVMPILFTSYIC